MKYNIVFFILLICVIYSIIDIARLIVTKKVNRDNIRLPIYGILIGTALILERLDIVN